MIDSNAQINSPMYSVHQRAWTLILYLVTMTMKKPITSNTALGAAYVSLLCMPKILAVQLVERLHVTPLRNRKLKGVG